MELLSINHLDDNACWPHLTVIKFLFLAAYPHPRVQIYSNDKSYPTYSCIKLSFFSCYPLLSAPVLAIVLTLTMPVDMELSVRFIGKKIRSMYTICVVGSHDHACRLSTTTRSLMTFFLTHCALFPTVYPYSRHLY
jgi:hypothetical protein